MNRAIFLGVLVKACGIGHGPFRLERIQPLPGIREPLLRLRAAGYLVVLATTKRGPRGDDAAVVREQHRQ